MTKVKIGDRFCRLKVIGVSGGITCICDCGKTIRLPDSSRLTRGNNKSCGCLNKEKTIERNKTAAKFGCFSKRYPRTFLSWRSMLNRCYNKKQKSYEGYGSKGVKVCQYLRSNPQALKDILGLRTKKNPSLDRFPIHNGNYTCGKCNECIDNKWKLNIRWTTRSKQSENRGKFNVWITAFGRTLIRKQWERESGINEETIRKRLIRGWTPEKALATPDKQGNCYRHNV